MIGRRLGGIGFALALSASACASDPAPGDTAAEAPSPTEVPTAVATLEPTEDSEPAAPAPSPSEPPAEAAPPSELETIVTDFIGDEPGGIIVLSRVDGIVETVVVGDADASGTPLTVDTPMRVGSITKPFVAAMIMQLVDSGDVDLDATIDTYLGSPPLGGDVTVRQLLEHRSGLPNYTDQPGFFSEAIADPSARLGPGDVLAWVSDLPAEPAGPTFRYSNTNYILLGTVLESADQSPLDESLRARIVDPAGLAATWFDLGEDRVGPGGNRVAEGWSRLGYAGQVDAPYTAVASGAWAAGSLISTAPDLLRFLDALRDGTLVDGESLAAMVDTDGDRYGLGVGDGRLGLSGDGYGHDGGIPGFVSSMRIARDSDDAIIILINNDALDLNQLRTRILLTF